MINVALIGNPNCGKTTMFNNLTGNIQYVGNWPGVTVDKKMGKIRKNKDISIIDLPGIYSLSPYTLEEIITRKYIIDEKPDVIINIIDASNIERNLYLTTQVIEMGIPVVLALNMMDIVAKRGDIINKKELEKEIGCSVVETTALKGHGLDKLVEEVVESANLKKMANKLNIFSKEVSDAINTIKSVVNVDGQREWIAIKIFEKDKKILEEMSFSKEQKEIIDNAILGVEKAFGDDSESITINERYTYIESIIKKISIKKEIKTSISDKIDSILTNRIFAFPIFMAVMTAVYYIAITLGAGFTDWTNDVFFGEYVNGIFDFVLTKIGTSPWLYSLVMDGIVNGVGAILGFVPQMIIVFFLLTLLEECGYMARVAFIMDRVFKKFGLSGKSFIPILISSGCGVPGIMASRTIESEKDRKITVITTTFIPCSAKLPIIALFSAALFPNNIFIGPSVYFMGIGMIIVSGIILKKMKIFAGDTSPFIMELPQYHIPSPRTVFIHIADRVKAFITKAGTIIFVSSIVLWVLGNLDFGLNMVDTRHSILAKLGNAIAPIFTPLGFGNWEATVASITGLVAKETLVTTYSILFGLTEGSTEFVSQIGKAFTPSSAYAFVMFNMLCAPCFAAIGAIKREMGNWRWTAIAVGYQCFIAYIVGFIIYNIGTAIATGSFLTVGSVISVLLIICILYLLCRKNKYK